MASGVMNTKLSMLLSQSSGNECHFFLQFMQGLLDRLVF